jgi:hypothetical protein
MNLRDQTWPGTGAGRPGCIAVSTGSHLDVPSYIQLFAGHLASKSCHFLRSAAGRTPKIKSRDPIRACTISFDFLRRMTPCVHD